MDSTGISKDKFIDNVAEGILGKIPDEYDLERVKKHFGVTITPTTIVLFQELERFNRLIGTMKRTLTQLRKVCSFLILSRSGWSRSESFKCPTCQAIVGEIGMDTTLESISTALYNGVLPKEWIRLAPDTRKTLGGWMEHFVKRIAQYTNWVCG